MDEFILELFTPLPLLALFAIIAASLLTLSKGADILIDEAVAISNRLRIPKAIIGATIVSLGTTLPEVSVSVMAALNGNPDLALGNAVGSIIADTGLIMGIAALISPLVIDYKAIKFQSWIQILSAALIVIFSLPFLSKGDSGYITQPMGWFLVLALGGYLYWSFKNSRNSMDSLVEEQLHEHEKESVIKQFLLLIIGMATVILSSKVLIPAVELTAIRIGIPQSIIAATLVAFGTSLPELTTSIKSVLRGHGDLAVGNIIGADILNVLFVIGVSASVTSGGLRVPENFYTLHYPAMMIILVAFRAFTLNKNHKITRLEGAFLLGMYLLYLAMNYLL